MNTPKAFFVLNLVALLLFSTAMFAQDKHQTNQGKRATVETDTLYVSKGDTLTLLPGQTAVADSFAITMDRIETYEYIDSIESKGYDYYGKVYNIRDNEGNITGYREYFDYDTINRKYTKTKITPINGDPFVIEGKPANIHFAPISKTIVVYYEEVDRTSRYIQIYNYSGSLIRNIQNNADTSYYRWFGRLKVSNNGYIINEGCSYTDKKYSMLLTDPKGNLLVKHDIQEDWYTINTAISDTGEYFAFSLGKGKKVGEFPDHILCVVNRAGEIVAKQEYHDGELEVVSLFGFLENYLICQNSKIFSLFNPKTNKIINANKQYFPQRGIIIYKESNLILELITPINTIKNCELFIKVINTNSNELITIEIPGGIQDFNLHGVLLEKNDDQKIKIRTRGKNYYYTITNLKP